MHLYKFKRAADLLHVLDIVSHERLYCCEYQKLNDPFEGQFRHVLAPAIVVVGVDDDMMRMREVPTEERGPRVRDLSEVLGSQSRVCSLTRAWTDVRMWSLYGDAHCGMMVEIDFRGIEGDALKVTYNEKLPQFEQLFEPSMPSADFVLTQKTHHWAYEAEYRVITDKEYFSVANRVRSVTIGARAEMGLEKVLERILPKHVGLFRARIDSSALNVVRDRIR